MTTKKPNIFDCGKLPDREHASIKAVYAGEADEGQQRLCLMTIVNKFSRTHDLLYSPGCFDETAFMAGRGFVGQQILHVINVPVGKLK